jgi:hypothetical protein
MSKQPVKKQTVGNGKPGPGRPKGVPNKTTTQLKEAILAAAEESGGPEGLVGYLKTLATTQPVAFAGLLGKVLPLTLQGSENGGPLVVRWLNDSDPVPPA